MRQIWLKIIINTKNKGISLIELAVVMLLISILITMGFSSFDSSIKAQNAQSASDQSASAIKKAKYYSRSKGIITSLNFPVGSNSYSILADGVNLSNNNLFDATSGVLPKNVVVIRNTCANVNFYVDGSPVDNNGNTITQDCSITIGYMDGNQKTLTIKGNTGNVIQN